MFVCGVFGLVWVCFVCVLGLVGGWLCFLLFVGGWVCFVGGRKCVCLFLVGCWVVGCVLVLRGVRVGLLLVVVLFVGGSVGVGV